jgi:DrrA-like phosphatidylinositol 4-phosphate binding protein
MPSNKFHYIWMGNYPGGKYEGAFKDSPNALAKQLRECMMEAKERKKNEPNPQDQEIIMWVPRELIDKIKESKLLDPDITLKPIEDIYDSKRLSKKEKQNLKTTIDLLGEHKAYASQKDLLLTAILEEYGGHLFDTTTSIGSIRTLMNHQPDDVWFPRITNEAEKMYNDEAVILPDIWALYSPAPGDGTFKAMQNSYIERCQFYFPEAFQDKVEEKSKPEKSGYTYEYGAGAEIMRSPQKRDIFIGDTAIFSFLDGLDQTKGPLTDARMRELSSFAAPTEEGINIRTKKIEELGLLKAHKGMWRNNAKPDEKVSKEILPPIPAVEIKPEAIAPPSSTPAVEVRQEALSIPAVEVKQEEVVSPAPAVEIKQKQQNLSSVKNDWHFFKVEASQFKDFPIKYEALKGDILKDQIIKDFEERLSLISDKDTLDRFVRDFKTSNCYKVLATPQGVASKLLSSVSNVPTSSTDRVEKIIKAKESQLQLEDARVSRNAGYS